MCETPTTTTRTTLVTARLVVGCWLLVVGLLVGWLECYAVMIIASSSGRVLYGKAGIPGGGVNQSLNLPRKIEFGLGPGIRFPGIGLICHRFSQGQSSRKSRPAIELPTDIEALEEHC